MQNCDWARIDILGFILLSAMVTGVHSADAQDNRLYAGVSGMLSTQGSVVPGEGSSIPTSGVGGTAMGISGEFGTFLKPALSLAFEASVPARFESIQRTGIPNSQKDQRHRDLVFSGLFHIHTTPAGPIRVGLVAGPTVMREDTLQRVAYAPFGSVNFGPYGPETSLTRWTVGLTVGADIGVQVSPNVQIVPQIRLHWVERASLESGNDNASAFLGLTSWVIRPAVGVRVSF